MNLDERHARLVRLPRRTRQLVEMLVRRPDLTVVDVAGLLQMSVHNARKRLRCEVYPASGLDVENRTHLASAFRDVVELEAAPDASIASSE